MNGMWSMSCVSVIVSSGLVRLAHFVVDPGLDARLGKPLVPCFDDLRCRGGIDEVHADNAALLALGQFFKDV